MTDKLASLKDAVAVRQLAGLSRANVYLLTRDGRYWFVRKIARDASANDRLRKQIAKQRSFAELLTTSVRTPKILDEGITDGCYFADMEFIHGPDATSHLRQASYAQISDFSLKLCEYLELASSLPPVCAAPHQNLFESLFAKLCEVQRSTGLMCEVDLARLFLTLDRVRTITNLSPTLCHGDMTLQNMIVDASGAVWVVDLLDAPFEHYWQDIAKLHQDLAGGWFLREEPAVACCALDYVSRNVLQTAVRLCPEYPLVHNLLVAATFVRILPYARTVEERAFVSKRISYFAEQATLAAQ